jgi:hypothetical protein
MTLGFAFVAQVNAQPAGGFAPGGAPLPQVNAKNLLTPLPPPTPEELRATPPVADPHNLAGTWLVEGLPFAPSPMSLPPTIFTEKARQLINQHQQQQRAADSKGQVLLTDSGRCRPGNGLAVGGDLFPAEVIQGKDKIVILNEELRGRWVIHMNRDHRKDVKDTFFGDSVGHWEGDTLVVDTIGVRESLSMYGMYSNKARIVSRLRKINGGQKLEWQTTVHDPETYLQPLEGPKFTSYWHPGVQMLEFQCEENMEGAREGMAE